VLGGAGAADGDTEFAGRFRRPEFAGGRSDLRERHLHTTAVHTGLADAVDEVEAEIRLRRSFEAKGQALAFGTLGEDKLAILAREAEAVLAQFSGHESIRLRQALIPVDERENATTGAAHGEAEEPLHGDIAEA